MTWEQPESPSMEDQSNDSDLSDVLTLARERSLISHALDSMARLIGEVGDISGDEKRKTRIFIYRLFIPYINFLYS